MWGCWRCSYLFLADAAVLSHDRQTLADGSRDNVFNYANRAALKAFERTWEQQTSIPSSQSADGESDVQVRCRSL
jgi:hypothetical protein